MRVPGLKALRRRARQIRSRLYGGVVVLGYHRIGERDGGLGLAVSPRHFAAQMEFLARHMRPMRLVDAVRRPVPFDRVVPQAVVTFDDGYRDTWETALPVLERLGIPATVFVTTGRPGQPFWWDELTRILTGPSLPERLDLTIEGRRHQWKLGRGLACGTEARGRLIRALADVLRRIDDEERGRVLDRLRAWAGTDPPAGDAGPRALTVPEIRQLGASPQIDIGGHTRTHPMLPALSPDQQRREIGTCRTELRDITGRPVEAFAYPYGARSDTVRSLVAEAGFTLACGSEPDALRPGADPLAIPRLWARDEGAEGFARWLRPWLP